MHVLLIADLGVDFTTGSHLKRALELNGHTVTGVNERPHVWSDLDPHSDYDFVLWNSTPGYAPPETFEYQQAFLARCRDYGCPVVYYHLDLYWGLPQREQWIKERPAFQGFGCDLYATADGGHDEQWADAGLDHVWFPPGVLEADCTPGVFREEYASDVAFVGSWNGYHRESVHRMELVGHLKSRWGSHVRFWPKRGQPSIRGQDLNDLYASTKVVVGDSCLVPRLKRYWSDRVPETTGRGGHLLHPWVEGLSEFHPHVQTWEPGNWAMLDATIEGALDDSDGKAANLRAASQAVTLKFNTYEVRMRRLVDAMNEKGLL